MRNPRYVCCLCGTLTNSIRCPQCGSDTEQYETDTDAAPLNESPRREPSHDMQDTLNRAHLRHQARRFSGRTPTGFGGLQ